MKKDSDTYFSWKFFPTKENRETPDSRKIDDNDLFQLLKWRNDVRLFILNWRNVWYTYRYLLNYYPFFALLVWAVSGSWIVGMTALSVYIPFRIIVDRKINFLDQLQILMPAFIDRKLLPVFGKLLPFTSD